MTHATARPVQRPARPAPVADGRKLAVAGPARSPSTLAIIASAPSLEETMRIARDIESAYLVRGWSDAKQAQEYVDEGRTNSQAFLSYWSSVSWRMT